MSQTRKDYIALIAQHGNHFKPSEFEGGGGITNIDYNHFKNLLLFRKWHGYSTIITSGYRANSGSSQHGKGLATDQMLFKDYATRTPISFEQAWTIATTWPWHGVGLYFDWYYTHNNVEIKVPGLHLDNGELITKRPLRWLCKKHGNVQHYYYQDIRTELFYNRERNEYISLSEAFAGWGYS